MVEDIINVRNLLAGFIYCGVPLIVSFFTHTFLKRKIKNRFILAALDIVIFSLLIAVIFIVYQGYFYSVHSDKFSTLASEGQISRIYIPKDLDDCFKELKKRLSPELIEEMKTGTENDMNKYHHGLGMWMRNNWGLWSNSRLKKYFNDLGIRHPDDMSGIILTSFWRYLNDKPIKLQEQIKYYQDYWKKIKEQKK